MISLPGEAGIVTGRLSNTVLNNEIFIISSSTCQAEVLPGNGCSVANTWEKLSERGAFRAKEPSLGLTDAVKAPGKSSELLWKSCNGSSICCDFSRKGKSLDQGAASCVMQGGGLGWVWAVWPQLPCICEGL